MRRSQRAQAGFTYLEMVATAAIVMILASAVLPLARVTRTRQKEIELRRELRLVRTQIDEYWTLASQGKLGDVKLGSEFYPPDLETLVKGAPLVGTVGSKKKFLRRIPTDPMTVKAEWGMRCYQDEPDSDSWCGSNVYDVYSLSAGKALDGSKYKDW